MRHLSLLAIGCTLLAAPLGAQSNAPFAVDYYYRIKWGYTAEWMELYKRNPYPILVRQQEMGRIVSMTAVTPFYHAGETDRWDLRFTIVWKNADVAHDDFDSSSIIRALYPDSARFQREEQRRFELLLQHMDVPVVGEDLTRWKRTP